MFSKPKTPPARWTCCGPSPDVQMPGALDGLALVQLVKVLFPEVRVVLTSGFSPKNLCGIGVPFLPKPFSPCELVALVRAQLRGSARAGFN